MAKVDGPLMSFNASGTLGDTITFSRWKGRSYVRTRVIPSNPRSGGQTGRRAMFKFLTQAWNAIPAGPKATWQPLADELVASPFNAFIKQNMQFWHNFLTPSHSATRTEISNGSDRALDAAAWEENRIKLSTTAAVANEQWGILYFASLTTGFTPSVGTAIITELDEDITARDTFWTPPSVATWYFNSITFSDDGIKETAGGEEEAIP